MNEFFGLSMTYIMIALLCVLAVALSTVGYVLVRQRIIFMVGVRNIPRRRAQTALIIVGLMLSTMIISTALSIGDTADYSITNTAYNELHSIDEIVSTRSQERPEDAGGATETSDEDDHAEQHDAFESFGSIISPLPIPEARADAFADAFRQIDGVDGAIKVLRAPVPVSNPAKGQTEPLSIIVGLPADLTGFESDLESTSGERLSPADLARDEIYASNDAAEKLDIAVGDGLTFFVGGTPREFRVRDIVNDHTLTGSIFGETFGFVLEFERAQTMFARPDEADLIAVSNEGGVREGVSKSDDVTDALNEVLEDTQWAATPTKKEFVDIAGEAASFLTTFFVVLGLFSIASGMLLIFLIFVMLAAERKVEMGMVRAVGTKRLHLVQMFMSEGMVYNVTSAAIGCALGVAVSIGMVQIMARLFAEFGLQVSFHVTARSLIVAYSIGVVLTFLTVTFSSWRIGNLNIVSAIRDLPDPVKREERPRFGTLSYIRWLLIKPASLRAWGIAFAMIVAGAALLGLTVAFFIASGLVYSDTLAGGSLAVLLGVIGGASAVAGAVLVLAGFNSIFQAGILGIVFGVILCVLGWNIDSAANAFIFGAGITMFVIGLALTVRYVGAPARPIFTTMGVVILVFWLLYAGSNIPGTDHLDGDIEMFFLSGVAMVIASTFVLVYNADLLLGLLTLTGGVFSSLMPSIRTAVAYPLANKFRTGATIAMISLVIFSLVTFSTINYNFNKLFLQDEALGGYDVLVTENPSNPLDDLQSALDQEGSPPPGVAGVDRMSVANRQVSEATQLDDDPKSGGVAVYGVSSDFIANNDLTFDQRAEGFESDEEIWAALAQNPDYAVVDAFKLPGGGGFGGGGFFLEDIENTDKTFSPIPVEIRNAATGASQDVEIIGILSFAASGLFSGIFVTEPAFDRVFDRPDSTIHYVRLESGTDAGDTAKAIERTLLAQGVQAESLRQIIDDFQAQNRGFLYLLQGFMGIGLFVGIAAVGVIAFRTVVERRQQIGMLRALGYTRRAVALSFVMESSFTALLGIVSGIGLALLLAYQLINAPDFETSRANAFYVPWLQVIGIGAFALIASLIMTIIPSRQASSIPIAEALRYE